MGEPKVSFPRITLFAALAFSPVAVPAALAQEGARVIEEVVVTGSRRPGRTATESSVPVDVFDGSDFAAQGTTDMNDLLRNLVPSYNVQRLPISDAASIVRPPTMRGLPADNTLMLVNGKRWHRSAVIAELGGSLNSGSQGSDTYSIPAIALKQVEVLRDGAAAQYGSDAIAGVINFQLKDDREGMTFEAKWGETYEGDGDSLLLATNIGMPLGPNGFANASLQWRDTEDTSRSVQRNDAAGLAATGNPSIEDPAQPWGSPKIEDDWAFVLNAGIDLTDTQHLYAFGNYAQRDQSNGFFYRNPHNRAAVFTYSANFDADGDGLPDRNASGSLLSRNFRSQMDFNAGPGGPSCAPILSGSGSSFDGFLGTGDPNCFTYNEWFPGGFTPTFGAKLEDISGAVGVRGVFTNGLLYDFSVRLARNEVGFYLSNTVNPSMGTDSPRSFEVGKYIQTEQNYNADFSIPVNVDGLYSPLNVAFGLEYRNETFEIRQGEESSWLAGPFAFQGEILYPDDVIIDDVRYFQCIGTVDANGNVVDDCAEQRNLGLGAMSIGANGFAGFSPTQVGEFRRTNYAAYVDLEADVTERWTAGAALRFEDFSDFGTTTNYKLATRFQVADNFALRGSINTGFRAPTPGQANVTKVSTRTVDGVLQQAGQIPPTNPIAQILGGTALDPEESFNWTVGFVWDVGGDLTITADYYNIELTDRITNTGLIGITQALRDQLEASGIPGGRDLESVDFYVNGFDTTTQGVDLVATYFYDWGNAGITNFTLAWNWTETEIDDVKFRPGTTTPLISRNRALDLENFNPEHRVVFSINHSVGDFGVLLRANYYDDWVVGNLASNPRGQVICSDNPANGDRCYDGAVIFDLELSYTLNNRYTFVAGAQNLFDKFPDKDPNRLSAGNSGNEYTTSSPWGMDGGFWYLRFRADLY
jgi:iron complex outermembrane recepter protein